MLKPRTCLGLDVGRRDVKLVELRKTGRKYEIIQAVRIPLSQEEGTDALSTALASYILESRTSPANVVCSMPAYMCSVKFAQVPKAKPVQLARMVRFEAESQIPMPLSELVWDYTDDGEKNAAMRHVVISAARKSDAEVLLGSMERAGVHPSALMVSALAGVKSVEHVGLPGHPILVVDIGTQWTDICLVDGGKVTSCRSVRLGSDDLTDAYVHDFKVDRDEAERLRQTHGIALNARNAAAESGAEISSVEVWADRIAEEMRRTTLSTGNGSNGSRPHKAVIIGGVTGLPSLTEGLSRRSGLTVEIGDPWNAMKLNEVCEHILREMPASFAVATGLAMSGLDDTSIANMMPQYVAEEKLRKRREVAVFSGMSVLAVILMVVYLVGGSTIGSKKAELRRLDAQVNAIKRDIQKAGPSIKPSAQVVKTTVTSVESKDYGAIELLRLLSIHLPRSLWLNEFSYEGGKSLVLKGQALSNSAIADAVDILTQLEKFESVTMDYSNLARGEGSQGYDFQITCTLPESKNGSAKSKTGSGKRSGAGLETGIVVQ